MAIRITDWGLFPDWVSSHARLADPILPMPNKGKSRHSSLPIALIPRLPDWVVQSVLPIAIHRSLHRLYSLARDIMTCRILVQRSCSLHSMPRKPWWRIEQPRGGAKNRSLAVKQAAAAELKKRHARKKELAAARLVEDTISSFAAPLVARKDERITGWGR